MTRRLPEEMEGKELAPLCLALRLDESRKIEEILDKNNMDYTFEITPYSGDSVFSILFGGIKKGITFLVPSEHYEFCRNLLGEEGLKNLILE